MPDRMDARGRVVGLSLVLAALACTPAVAQARGPVYVVGAKGLSVTQRDGGPAVVRLSDPTAHATHVSARGRARGGMTTQRLVRHWRKFGFHGRALATIDPAGDRRGATLVRLGRPRLVADGTALVAPVRVVGGSGGPLADRLVDRAAALPATAGPTTLSIDADGVDPPPVPGQWVRILLLHSLLLDGRPGDPACDGWAAASGTTGSCTLQVYAGLPPFVGCGCTWAWTDGLNAMSITMRSQDQREFAKLVGSLPDTAYTLSVSGGYVSSPDRPVHTGADPKLVGKQGGPLAVDPEPYYNQGTGATGTTVRMEGYVWQPDKPA